MKLLLESIKPYKVLVAAICAVLLLDIAGTLYVPTMLAGIINQGVTSSNTDFILEQGMYMLVACCCASGGALLGNYLCARLSSFVGRDIRRKVYEASLTFSGADFEKFGTGSMITRTLNDINVIQQTLMLSLQAIVPVPVICVMGTVLAFGIDAHMGALMLVVIVVVLVFAAIAVKRSAPIFERMQTFIDRMNVVLRENLVGVRVIRAFGKEQHEEKRAGRVFEDYASAAIKVNWIFAGVDCFSFCLMNIAEVLFMWLGGNRSGVGAIEIGSISAVIEYALIIMFYIMMAQFAALMVPRALVCLQRCAEVIYHVPSIQDGVLAPTAAGDGSGKELSSQGNNASKQDPLDNIVAAFEHVTFRFPDADEDTLCDIDFACERGKTTAIIGPTGSGKSTIAKLLLRLHDVSTGTLYVAGNDVRNMPQHNLRERISYVPQKAWLFSGTVASNLRYGNSNATDAELRHALDVAQSDFVYGLSDRLESRVAQGGTNFSGGQRQRLAIARALVKSADLYIFDDSFSALDFKTDAALRRALKHEMQDKALLIIAQRISTIMHADQIIVLKDGHIEGKGTHDELLATCATYKEIADSQLKGGE